MPAAVDAWVRTVLKNGAASDTFGEMQSLVSRMEEYEFERTPPAEEWLCLTLLLVSQCLGRTLC